MPPAQSTTVKLRHKTETNEDGSPKILHCQPVDAREHLKHGYELVSAPATFGKVNKAARNQEPKSGKMPAGASVAGVGEGEGEDDPDAPKVSKEADFKEMSNDDVAAYAEANGIKLDATLTKKKDRVAAIIDHQKAALDLYNAE